MYCVSVLSRGDGGEKRKNDDGVLRDGGDKKWMEHYYKKVFYPVTVVKRISRKKCNSFGDIERSGNTGKKDKKTTDRQVS